MYILQFPVLPPIIHPFMCLLSVYYLSSFILIDDHVLSVIVLLDIKLLLFIPFLPWSRWFFFDICSCWILIWLLFFVLSVTKKVLGVNCLSCFNGVGSGSFDFASFVGTFYGPKKRCWVVKSFFIDFFIPSCFCLPYLQTLGKA